MILLISNHLLKTSAKQRLYCVIKNKQKPTEFFQKEKYSK